MCTLCSVYCVESTMQAQRLETGMCLHDINAIMMSKKWTGSYDSGPKYRSIGVRGGGRGERHPPRAGKNSGQTRFSGQALLAQKSRMIKKYLNSVKHSRATLFFKASASCSKILSNKKYIFSTVNSGPLCFSGQGQVTQKS